jgi:hypothetical protein
MPEEFVLYELPSEVWPSSSATYSGIVWSSLWAQSTRPDEPLCSMRTPLSCSAHLLTSKRSVPKQRPQVDNAHRGSVAAQ